MYLSDLNHVFTDQACLNTYPNILYSDAYGVVCLDPEYPIPVIFVRLGMAVRVINGGFLEENKGELFVETVVHDSLFIIIVCLHSALSTSGEDSKCSSDNLLLLYL